MNITRRNFLKLAGAAGILLSTGRAFAATIDEKFLIAYFSRTGEEYGVGTITKGNTAIVAEIISQKVGGDLFEIKPVTPYPVNYDECTKLASREKASNVRPAIVGNVANFEQYTTIFIGYPIWWGAYPMIVATFLESYDFGGKNIVPFCTHGGSGLSSTDQSIALACPTAKVLKGFAITGSTAQHDRAKTESIVDENLKRLDFIV